MLIPKHFEEHRLEEPLRVIREHSPGILLLGGGNGLDANHLPFELIKENDHPALHAHVARANPLWKDTKDGEEDAG